MIVSVNWLKKFTTITLPIDELAQRIGARLVELEQVINLGEKYKDVIIVRVVECEKMEKSDHLHVTKIDDGGVRKDVERDENGLIQVVCGAPNVRAGMLAAWLPPASVVPASYNDETPFVLGVRKMLGVTSNGMMAAADELDLFEDHAGILEIDAEVEPGASFAEVYELNDYLLDIENKSLTHRPDTFGIIGFAREVAAIQGLTFQEPDWLHETAQAFSKLATGGDVPAPTITIDETVCPRYQAVCLSVDQTKTSPVLLQTYLARSGVRPIDVVVDITNYLMLLTGQPLHAYDYDKLRQLHHDTVALDVRLAKKGENLQLLDGKKLTLTPSDIVIANGETPVALAGAMGGKQSEVDQMTTRILLESATFSLSHLRGTQMRHGIFSEAVTRFTKGQPAGLGAPVLLQAIKLFETYAGAQVLSPIGEAGSKKNDQQPITVKLSQIEAILGVSVKGDTLAKTLTHVGCLVNKTGDDTYIITPPYWRTDLHIQEDIAEEIGRINGFDGITPSLPTRPFVAIQPANYDIFRSRVRAELVRAGASEVLTYSFIHGDLLRRVGQDPSESYRIINSISPDLQYYRQSLTPSLLGLVHSNVRAGYHDFSLFEWNKVHSKAWGSTDEHVPVERQALALVVARSQLKGAAYYQARAIADFIFKQEAIAAAYVPLRTLAKTEARFQPFEPKRSAAVYDADGALLGVIGEYRQAVSKAFKLPKLSAGFELDGEALRAAAKNRFAYQPPSKYPGASRDICFQVEATLPYRELAQAVDAALQSLSLETSLKLLDIYQPAEATTKNITFRITINSYKKTLTTNDITQAVGRVTKLVTTKIKAAVL